MTILTWLATATLAVAVHTFIGAVLIGVTAPWWHPKGVPISSRFFMILSVGWPIAALLYLVLLYFLVVVGLPMEAARYVIARREAKRTVPPVGR